MTDAAGTTLPPCPECSSEYTYEMPPLIVCPECAHEFSADAVEASPAEAAALTIVDSVGNALADGDTVTITKTLKVKGAQQPLKSGTKVRGIRLNFDAGTGQEDHNIDCKIDGFGAMKLKPAVVKKA
ncbi:zinc ribbon domain-containing protein YjdM [Corynebacterium minutissimum]